MKTNNCNNCKNKSYSGGQIGYASSKGIAVDWLPYVYCIKNHIHTPKNATCEEHEKSN